MTSTTADAGSVERAAQALLAGALVAFPTETVYGLGADAGNREAVAAIYRTKGRPAGHPLIVHVSDATAASWWADLPVDAMRLIEACWPGPLSLILTRHAQAPGWACGEEPTVGLRCPSHPVAHALLRAFEAGGGRGVAAPSANRFGKVSPTTAQHVRDDLGAACPLLLDGGDAEVGLESTILDLSRGRPVLLRPGAIDSERIRQVLGRAPLARDAAAPRASGTLVSHYAPQTPIEIVAPDQLEGALAARCAAGERVVVWSPEKPRNPQLHAWRRATHDVHEFAHSLYATLRALDRAGADRMLVAAVPDDPRWDAVRDRLTRAAAQDAPDAP